MRAQAASPARRWSTRNQVVAYDLAHAAAAVACANAAVDYADTRRHRGRPRGRVHRRRDPRRREPRTRARRRVGRRGRRARQGGRARRPRAATRSSSPSLVGEQGDRLPRRRHGARHRHVPSFRRRQGSQPSPSTFTAPTATSPKTSSAASPSSARSACRFPRSTAAGRRAATTSTCRWSSPPRS